MSATAPAPLRLQPPGAVATRWGLFLSWAAPYLDDQHDPWVLYPFGLLGPRALPDLASPGVYAALTTTDECRYVGQTVGARDRFRGHGGALGKLDRWNYVVLAPLRDDIVHRVLGNAETTASRLLRPVEGSRTPRLR